MLIGNQYTGYRRTEKAAAAESRYGNGLMEDIPGVGRETGAVPFPRRRRPEGLYQAEFGWHHEVIFRSRPNAFGAGVFFIIQDPHPRTMISKC